jgi:MFS family permease
LSVGDAASYSVMVGMGETYIAAFAVALGTGGISTGLLTTLPIFAGSILQLMTPHAVRWLGSHRKWVVICATTQALALAMLPVAILLGGWSAALVYAAATLYWAAGQSSNPAWNTWIEDVVPKSLRTRFFARRSRISQMFLLSGFVIGGLLLELGKSYTTGDTGATNWTFVAFTTLFLVAAISRLASASFLAGHSEPNAGKIYEEHISLAQWSRRLRRHSGLRLLIFLFAMQASVYISGPFFTPYMLRELRFSYFTFMSLTCFCLVGKALALPFWGKFAHLYGARRLLWIGALSILPLPACWMLSSSYAWVALIQFVSGLTWAAFELAIVLMFFEAVPRHERTSLVTLYNLSNSAAMVVGTMLGAIVLRQFHESIGGYTLLFGMSSLSRVFAVLLLVRLSNVVESVPRVIEGALALHPGTEMDKPVLPGIPQPEEALAGGHAPAIEPTGELASDVLSPRAA